MEMEMPIMPGLPPMPAGAVAMSRPLEHSDALKGSFALRSLGPRGTGLSTPSRRPARSAWSGPSSHARPRASEAPRTRPRTGPRPSWPRWPRPTRDAARPHDAWAWRAAGHASRRRCCAPCFDVLQVLVSGLANFPGAKLPPPPPGLGLGLQLPPGPRRAMRGSFGRILPLRSFRSLKLQASARRRPCQSCRSLGCHRQVRWTPRP